MKSSLVACMIVARLLLPSSSSAAVIFYVDPDWTGNATGAASSPWTSLTAAAWTAINEALGRDDVVVYFSARAARSDVNQETTAALNILRADRSTHRLTLDGSSQYNVNDRAPSWTAYRGTHRFQIMASVPVSTAYAARSNVTLHGFRLLATEGQIIFWYGGDNVTWEDNEGSAAESNTWGPGFYFGYTRTEGNRASTPCVPRNIESCVGYTELTIRGNSIHDTFGEGIYVGGCGDQNGCLSHNGVTIEHNTIGPNIAVYGGEPDAVDLKDGLRNVVVRDNTITLQRDSRAGISLESGALVERNYVQGAGWAAIALSVFWNNSGATRAGTVTRNNILVNSGGNQTASYSARYGIYVDAGNGVRPGGQNDQFGGLVICSNTIYKVSGPSGAAFGISVMAPGTTVTNNIVVDAFTHQLRADAGTLAAHGHNLLRSSMQGAAIVRYGSVRYTASTITRFEKTGLCADPMFAGTSLPHAPDSFRLRPASAALGAGVPASTFSDDFFGQRRGPVWDIGAVQSSGYSR